VVLELRVEGLVGERQVVLVLAALDELGHRLLVAVVLFAVMPDIAMLNIAMLDVVARHSPTSRIRHLSCIICRRGR
jgi:hypothetical protein